MCSVTSWFRNSKESPRRCSMFASELVTRLSTQMTRWPRSTRYSQRWEPRKPAPPVTTEVGIDLSYWPQLRVEESEAADEEAVAEEQRPDAPVLVAQAVVADEVLDLRQ